MARKKPNDAADADEIVCGFHAVHSTVARTPSAVIEVLLDARRHDARIKKFRADLADAGVNFRLAARDELDTAAGGVRHQGVVARVRRRAAAGEVELFRLLDDATRPPLLLILDRVQDPHNLGACLRTAAAAGADAVVVPKDGACPVTPAVTRAAAGAVVPVVYAANLARTMGALRERGVWLTGGDAGAMRSVFDADFTAATAVVVGAEGKGLRRLTRERCDQLVRIPMATDAAAGLNVSVAAAVLLFEAVRQRG